MAKPFEEILPALRPHLAALEEVRKRQYRKWLLHWALLVGLVLTLGVGALFAGSLLENDTVFLTGAAVAAIGGICIYLFLVLPAKAKYVDRFKEQIVKPVAAAFGQDIEYDPKGYLPREYYDECELFDEPAHKYEGEDRLDGRIGETDFSMCELHTRRAEKTPDKDRPWKKSDTIFRGLFMWADFHKDFNGQTFVQPDVLRKPLEKLVGRAARKISATAEKQLVVLEDPEFEKAFKTLSSDQVEARYILSTAMMRRILDLKQKFEAEVSIAFMHSSIFIAIPLHGNLLDPHFRRTVLDEAYLRKFYDQMAACLGIIEDLGLNVRIWSK